MACQKITENEYVEQKMNTHNELVNIGKELALREHEKRMKSKFITLNSYNLSAHFSIEACLGKKLFLSFRCLAGNIRDEWQE